VIGSLVTDKITTLVDVNSHLTVREIQKIFDISHGSVVAHFRDADYVSRMNVPHELSNENLQHLHACDLLLKRKQKALLFERNDHCGQTVIVPSDHLQ